MATIHLESDGEIRLDTTGNADKFLKATSAGGVEFSSPIVISGATVVDAQTSPTSWTDLDLSGIVGSSNVVAILSFTSTMDMDFVAVRSKGDTDEYFNTQNQGCTVGVHKENTTVILICITDASGVIQWITESSGTATVKVIAYIK